MREDTVPVPLSVLLIILGIEVVEGLKDVIVSNRPWRRLGVVL
jgi:hypothetical protein